MKPVTYKCFDITELTKAFHYAKGLLERSKDFAKFLGVHITITLGKTKRSIKQNRYYRGVIIKMMAEEYGCFPNEMHEMMKQEFLRLEDKDINGKKYIITKSTTMLKTDEFEEHNENCRMYASINMSLYIPKPNEVPDDWKY